MIWYLVGDLDDIFIATNSDDDDDPENGYTTSFSSARPAPAGVYTLYLKSVRAS